MYSTAWMRVFKLVACLVLRVKPLVVSYVAGLRGPIPLYRVWEREQRPCVADRLGLPCVAGKAYTNYNELQQKLWRLRWTLARECLAGPSTAQTQRLTDTQSALRRFPQHRTQGFATDLECKCIPGAKIPHAVCANTTRVSPRKGQLLRECVKNAQLGARAS